MFNCKFVVYLLAVPVFLFLMSGCARKPAANLEEPAYLGCYKDQGSPWSAWGRDLDRQMFNSQTMTIATCVRDCAALGYRFAGLQSSSQCFCGDDYGKFGEADNCDKRCVGNDVTVCGGTWANSVYSAAEWDPP